ncbi:TolC family protein [Pyxidicoccus fallax]|uniref:TolC family protein n=1 Tax=Pyxidicoccus fallax TaxID=394095 RepID=A0A848LH57_9BACT|nr:TolC family protein [Pyxidicoccus fallax]NMO17253.1 TolC family protein [Pyxidicoccus fallax]NPC78962.1 TolC family protein [Pyxidicoccus fallax]
MLLTLVLLVALPDPFNPPTGSGSAVMEAAGIPEALTAPAPPTLALSSWDDALGRLRARSVDLQLALAQLELAGAETRLALAPLLPGVGASVSVQERLVGQSVSIGGGNINVDGDDDGPRPTSPLVALRATASQSVVDVPAWLQLSAARARERSARASARDTWRLLVRELARSLVAVVTAERVVEIDRMGLAQAWARHQLTLDAEKLGSGRKLDTLRTARDLEVARASLLASVEALRRTREALGSALGVEGEAGVVPAFRLEGLARSVAELCRPLEGASRADLVAAGEASRAVERELGASRAAYAPTLGLESSLTATTVTPGTARVNQWNIAAVLAFDVWDGGARGATVRSARADVAVAEQQLEAVRRTLAVEVARARRGVALAEARRLTASRAREAAALTDQLTGEAFREGVGTSLELVQSAEELREAERTLALRELDLVQARVESLMAEAECAL